MPTCKLTTSQGPYVAKSGDFICMIFMDGRTPCFDKSSVPPKLFTQPAPKEKGGSATLFVGEMGGARIAAKQYRLDKPGTPPLRQAKMIIASALNQAKKLSCKRVVVPIQGQRTKICLALQEGALLGGYVFDKYLTKKKKPLPVVFVTGEKLSGDTRAAMLEGATIADCVNFARDVLNEPPNVIHPTTLATEYERFGAERGLTVTVWNEKRLEKENCGGILGVGQGASSRPRLVIGEYAPADAKIHLALVGKGVTFDTGGYCLKPGASQVDMKMDMAGSAMMFAAAGAICALGLPIRVTVFTPLVENDISSTAYHTSDILTMRSGRTVQVDNTDAEGRLILADALTLACEGKPDYLVDAATLTGACVVALGEDIAGVYGNKRDFAATVIEAGNRCGEYLWEMPLHMPYAKQLETTVADCKNIGSRWGGSITAALFLEPFVSKDQAWVHMDVAGPAGKQGTMEHLGKGAKGFGVKSMVSLARILIEK